MAVRTSSSDAPKPPEAQWEPEPGHIISTVRVQQLRDAYVAVEHPADMTPEDLSAALGHRSAELGKCDWWDASTKTEVVECVLGRNEPDNLYAEPISIKAADVTAPPPVAIVEEFSEDAP